MEKKSPSSAGKSPATKRTKRREPSEGERQQRKGRRKPTASVNEATKRTFDGNEYTGILKKDSLGVLSLDAASAKYVWPGRACYEGPFVDSQIEGKGKYSWPDGSWYQGDVVNGRRHGEGVYVAPDGTTKYEGQWQGGKRHGVGRLSYDALGESHYAGQWADGAKHGEGRQIWPSGNVYEGQWRLGKMSGIGTMTWCDGGTLEVYAGLWEDNHPQGEGVHTWHASESKGPDAGAARAMPSQQLNNRYEGAWDRGVRHGTGTFSYANGARYHGAWVENVKEGAGRYTLEDGRVYQGPFQGDQMVGPDAPQVPKYQASDNPVRACINISDLLSLALPVDVPGREARPGSGSEEAEEVLHEVHNMLLRYLSELKQLYGEYRRRETLPEEDPFALSLRQFWLLARDFGLVTPACPLSRVDRHIFSGPRHLQETLPNDEECLRPLTPRLVEEAPKRATSATRSQAGGRGRTTRSATLEMGPRTQENLAQLSGEEEEEEEYMEDEESVMSGATSMASLPQGMSRTSSRLSNRESHQNSKSTATAALGAAGPPANPLSPSKSAGDADEGAMPCFTDFWRNDQSGELADIHAPSRQLLFRHFLEAVVRAAVARFPQERGLEHQVARLLKERVGPNLAADRFGAEDYLQLPGVETHAVLQGLRAELWRPFAARAAGEGAYGRPQWAACEAAEAAGEETAPWRPRRGHGGPQRRVHALGRKDVTCRVKDVLRLLDSSGLLRPVAEGRGSELLERAASNPYGKVFEPRGKTPVHEVLGGLAGGLAGLLETAGADADVDVHSVPPERGSRATSPQPRPASRGTTSSRADSPFNMGQIMGGLKNVADASEAKRHEEDRRLSAVAESAGRQSARPTALATGGGTTSKDAPRFATQEEGSPGLTRRSATPSPVPFGSAPGEAGAAPDAAPERPELPLEEVLKCEDFSASFVDVLGILTEVMQPASLEQLRLAVATDQDPSQEQVALAEYLESELTFAEFQRLLARLADRLTKDCDMDGLMPLHRRVEGFLRLVFLPSLQQPYRSGGAPSPEAPGPEASGEAAAREAAETPQAPPADGEGAEPQAEAPASAAPQAPREPEGPAFWRGFCDEASDEISNDLMGRCWPSDFDPASW